MVRIGIAVAAVLAAPGAMAQTSAQCRAVEAAIGEFIRAERAHIGRDAAIDAAVAEMMIAAYGQNAEQSIPLRTDGTSALGALQDRRAAALATIQAMEDFQHRARLCARAP